MTFTYEQPTGTPLSFGDDDVSHVRFLLRDTKQSAWSLSDEEIGMMLADWQAQNPGVEPIDLYVVGYRAAMMISESFAAAVGQMVRKKVGDTDLQRQSGGMEAKQFRALARRLLGLSPNGGLNGAGIAAGARQQPARVFSLRELDNPGTAGGDPAYADRG